ncbi:ABC transporter permease subunit [Cryptosporangium minutisporangium]|uniref:ABC-2 type transporter transmembrane domain-containing protein n=1 Tax=Cryptosporangium minutisporangium TaxID=113569 RepID=A0ABP6SXF3_9ACTN
MRHLVTSEFTKVRTIRSTVATLLLMAATTIGTALLVALTGSLHPGETALAGALGNSGVGLVVAGAFGVLVVSTEYSSGTMRATCAASPRRGAVLTAKVFVTAAPVFVVALVAAAIAYGVAGVLLDRASHPLGEPFPALFGVAACHAVAALLGLALGTALRNAAAGVSAVVGALLVPTLIGPLLGDAQPWVNGATPVAALQKLVGPTEGLGSLAAWPTVALMAAYTAAGLAASTYLFRTRDI